MKVYFFLLLFLLIPISSAVNVQLNNGTILNSTSGSSISFVGVSPIYVDRWTSGATVALYNVTYPNASQFSTTLINFSGANTSIDSVNFSQEFLYSLLDTTGFGQIVGVPLPFSSYWNVSLFDNTRNASVYWQVFNSTGNITGLVYSSNSSGYINLNITQYGSYVVNLTMNDSNNENMSITRRFNMFLVASPTPPPGNSNAPGVSQSNTNDSSAQPIINAVFTPIVPLDLSIPRNATITDVINKTDQAISNPNSLTWDNTQQFFGDFFSWGGALILTYWYFFLGAVLLFMATRIKRRRRK